MDEEDLIELFEMYKDRDNDHRFYTTPIQRAAARHQEIVQRLRLALKQAQDNFKRRDLREHQIFDTACERVDCLLRRKEEAEAELKGLQAELDQMGS